jgi:hypothetical protein
VQRTGALVGALALPEDALARQAEVLQRIDDLEQAHAIGRERELESAVASALAAKQSAGHERLQDLHQELRGQPELDGHVASELEAFAVMLRQIGQCPDGVRAGVGDGLHGEGSTRDGGESACAGARRHDAPPRYRRVDAGANGGER